MSSLHRQVSSRSSPTPRQQKATAATPPPAATSTAAAAAATVPSHDDQAQVAFDGLATSAAPPPPAAPTPTHVDFQPFFALVEDTVTREHFHPTVHYIFADDDPDMITEAACRSLEQQRRRQGHGHVDKDAAVTGTAAAAAQESSRYLPPPTAGVREHYLVVDVQPVVERRRTSSLAEPGASTPVEGAAATAKTAFEVVQAQSLSSEWQVLKTSITSAPTIGEQDGGGGAGDEGLMLRIQGRGHVASDALPPERERASMDDLIEQFQRGLDDIRQVMLAGGQGPGQQDLGLGVGLGLGLGLGHEQAED